jgi:hypothetical protein
MSEEIHMISKLEGSTVYERKLKLMRIWDNELRLGLLLPVSIKKYLRYFRFV